MLIVIFMLKILNGDILVPHVLSNLNINVPVFNLRNYNLLLSNSRIRSNYLLFEPLNNMIIIFKKNYDCIDFNLSYNTIKKKLLN